MVADIFTEFKRAVEIKQQKNQEEKGSMTEVKVGDKIILIKNPKKTHEGGKSTPGKKRYRIIW